MKLNAYLISKTPSPVPEIMGPPYMAKTIRLLNQTILQKSRLLKPWLLRVSPDNLLNLFQSTENSSFHRKSTISIRQNPNLPCLRSKCKLVSNIENKLTVTILRPAELRPSEPSTQRGIHHWDHTTHIGKLDVCPTKSDWIERQQKTGSMITSREVCLHTPRHLVQQAYCNALHLSRSFRHEPPKDEWETPREQRQRSNLCWLSCCKLEIELSDFK